MYKVYRIFSNRKTILCTGFASVGLALNHIANMYGELDGVEDNYGIVTVVCADGWLYQVCQ